MLVSALTTSTLMGSSLALAANANEPKVRPELAADLLAPLESPVATPSVLRIFKEAPAMTEVEPVSWLPPSVLVGLTTFLSGCEAEPSRGDPTEMIVGMVLGTIALAVGMTVAARQSRRRWEKSQEVPRLVYEIQRYEPQYTEQARYFTVPAQSNDVHPWPYILSELYGNWQQAVAGSRRSAVLAHGVALAGTFDWMNDGLYTHANGVLSVSLELIQKPQLQNGRPEADVIRDIFWLSFLKYFVFPKVTMEGLLKVFHNDLQAFVLKGGLGEADSISEAFTTWLVEVNQGADEPLRLEELPLFKRFYQELESFADPVVDEMLIRHAHVLEAS